ncbi:quinoprotein dehydrogenase-associated putative ABC transporter substrate-binding protein [Zavarzinia sp.]|uniref:quinoprotein dehydrogenase-associated putative ABC transporter substrate-binding protein n=1 Tax=Zavarzinia sp. TaxID=2027920 RepID=UPI00356A7CC9
MPKPPAWAIRAALALALAPPLAAGAGGAAAQQVPELASTDRLRVCADPANMPFSDKAGEGFENKIAAIVADELKRPLRFFWVPQGPGAVRNSLGSGLCDVIIGYASGADIVQHSNPYYRSAYVLVVKAGGPLDGVDRLEDPRLQGHRLGVIAATPPADHLLRLGLTAEAKTYALLVDRRSDSPAEEALADLAAGTVDGVILWGPIGGYFSKKAAVPLKVTPLVKETERPALSFRITFGIRAGEIQWKHKLNDVIRKRRADIEAVLTSYGVPLVPDDGRLDESERDRPVRVDEGQ